jgi:subtilisin family serine protease
MPSTQTVYTYRAGRKIQLEKRPDQFVVRALPDRLAEIGLPGAERVSSASSRVSVQARTLEPLMAAARAVAPTHHAYCVAGTDREFLITDRILVTFREAPLPERLGTFAAKYGLILRESYSDRDHLFQLTDHTDMNPVKLVVRLTESEPEVEAAEHDLNQRPRVASQFVVPSDPSYARQWHLHTRLQDPTFDLRASSRCEDAWRRLGGFGDPTVVVGLTDDGCRLDHGDFDSEDKFAGWAYFEGTRLVRSIDIDAEPRRMYQAGANHGTSCAGVIAAERDAALTVGAAPACRLFPIKWQSDGPSLFISDSKLLTALDWLADKVDILSNSWGSAPRSLWSSVVVRRIKELARAGGRRGRGILFLWAAGNENCPLQLETAVDVPFTDGIEVRPDGSAVWVGVEVARRFENNLVGIPGLAHVAALASTAQRSHYSNYGPGVTLCAPSSNSHEYSRLPVRGLGITTTTGTPAAVTARFGGTSSATPLVAGVAALVLSANPQLTALELLSLLKRTAAKDLEVRPYSRTPPAAFDPLPTWDVSPVAPCDDPTFKDTGDPDGTWSPWFGHGRVDAVAAVTEALRLRENAEAVPEDPGSVEMAS